ncbi:hypothetical protein ACFFX0_11160 [Citricoccus parietis]|uniref:Uncharacterized protein n=1 Tax=Citricoccus parietis TaxID=592307 RepID=A0ABV5FYG9_9MICC
MRTRTATSTATSAATIRHWHGSPAGRSPEVTTGNGAPFLMEGGAVVVVVLVLVVEIPVRGSGRTVPRPCPSAPACGAGASGAAGAAGVLRPRWRRAPGRWGW